MANKAVARANTALQKEIGYAGLQSSGGLVRQDFDAALRGLRGVRLYDEMRYNDPVVNATLGALKRIVKGTKWHAVPKGEESGADADKQAEFVTGCMDDMSHTWGDMMGEALTVIPFGWAYMEITYKLRQGEKAAADSNFSDGLIGWQKIALRGQETLWKWEIDEFGGIQGMWQSGPPNYKAVFIPIEKAILFRLDTEKNNPEGVSLLRGAVRPYLQKKHFEDILAIGAERDLTGIPQINLPFDADDADFETAQAIVESIRQDDQAGIVMQRFGKEIHENWEFLLVGSPGTKSVDVEKAIDRNAGEISLVFLAQFLRLGMSGSGGSYALGKEQKELWRQSVLSILTTMKETMDRFMVAPLCKLNGQKVLVELMHDPIPQTDLDGLAMFVQRLAAGGFIHPDSGVEEALRSMVDLPEIIESEMPQPVDPNAVAALAQQNAQNAQNGAQNGGTVNQEQPANKAEQAPPGAATS